MSTTTIVEESHERCPVGGDQKGNSCPYDAKDHPRIPGPKGNILDLNLKAPYGSFLEIQKQYGPIFQMIFAGKREISICTRELADEVCDETRYHKLVSSGVSTLRQVVEDALFTAHHGSRQWGITHRILKPIFGPLKIRSMFDEMKDVAEQLCLKWARHGGAASIDMAGDYTRLTLDTISLCMMDYRFNSFYLDGQHHPFVKHMVAILSEADIQAMLPDWAGFFRPRAMRKFKKDIQLMTDLCRGMVETRRANPVARDDFLNAMLKNKDPETGESLNDDEIVRNLITFLVAGHETTSGMLSFATYYLLAKPETLARARQEVDEVVGDASITLDHLQKLPYLDAVFREALRLMPTAVAFYVTPYKPELLGGKYLVEPGEAVCLLLDPIHRDRAVYGDDADEWKPERMMQDKFDALPRNAWKPFGNGARICLGMAFSWQEAKLALAMILQNFDLSMDDPSYKLRIKHLLTIKPEGFNIRAKLRHGSTATDFHRLLRAAANQAGDREFQDGDAKRPAATRGPMTILYGSDTGTCEALANRLAAAVEKRGWTPSVAYMNSAVKQLPEKENGPVAFICATYHGKAAPNAAEFMAWTEELEPGDLQNVQYAVLGCGHSDWTSTFYMIPTLLDARLEAAGAERLIPMGRINNARDDPFEGLDSWTKDLWHGLKTDEVSSDPTESDPGSMLTVSMASDIDAIFAEETLKPFKEGFGTASVTKNKTLATNSEGAIEKGHIEMALPDGLTYEAGYHVQIMPQNDASLVERALSRFGLPSKSVVTVSCRSDAMPPAGVIIDRPLKALHLFAGRDLRRAVSSNTVGLIAKWAADDATRSALEAIQADMDKNDLSLLDIVEKFSSEALPLPLGTFLAILPQMMPRTYSFSSSPAYMATTTKSKSSQQIATITFGVVNQHHPNMQTRGVGSNYLASLKAGEEVHLSIQKRQDAPTQLFRLPSPRAQADTPIIMIGAGTGLAPFMGFVQQRHYNQQKDAALAPAWLFFGCRSPGVDDMYREELDAFERDGVVTVRRAYSRPEQGEAGRYVTEALRECAVDVVGLWDQGAVIYICGSKKLSDGVLDVLTPLLFEADKKAGRLGVEVMGSGDWIDGVARGRYVVEVFT